MAALGLGLRAELRVHDAIALRGGTKLNYSKFELPPARSGETTFVEDVADLVDKLHNTAKVI